MTALTIGVFDGVHVGHQRLLHQLHQYYPSTILSFSNHPSEILRRVVPPPLTPPPIKKVLLQETGTSEVILIPFTQTLANLTFEEFLEPYQISHLVLGEDATFGKECMGTPDTLRLLGRKRGFAVHALPKLCINGKAVSSSYIRYIISEGNLLQAETLLGHPYFFYYSPGTYFTALLPPDGEYSVWSHNRDGITPITLKIQNRNPISPINGPQLISFSSNLNPLLFNKICQTSLVES